ncbi:hypothetical protein Anas_01114 [Armadillidium nasatum]|uniref:Uncharacterized protein n=1 Tax=Armadillidium nasatum TaxID=96803 RepID=A0A5N5TLV7_9CRUS|nr:hypothetical protein Anas_01114 [Armadillidium nasatum]
MASIDERVAKLKAYFYIPNQSYKRNSGEKIKTKEGRTRKTRRTGATSYCQTSVGILLSVQNVYKSVLYNIFSSCYLRHIERRLVSLKETLYLSKSGGEGRQFPREDWVDKWTRLKNSIRLCSFDYLSIISQPAICECFALIILKENFNCSMN